MADPTTFVENHTRQDAAILNIQARPMCLRSAGAGGLDRYELSEQTETHGRVSQHCSA